MSGYDPNGYPPNNYDRYGRYSGNDEGEEAYPDETPEPGYAEQYDPYAPYEEDAGYEQPYETYAEPEPPPPRRPARKETVLSANATINLTCTIAASFGLFALFLCFAERDNRVIRRFAVQSAGLFCVMAFASISLAVLGLIVGLIPLIGVVFGALFWAVWLALLAWDILQRVRLMLHAYRGLAYTVPLIGKHCRQFE